MRNILRALISSVLSVGVLVGTVSAETMYAKKNGVKVTTEKSPTSSVVTTLQLGDQVEVVKKKRTAVSSQIE